MFEEVIEELRAKLLIDSQNWASERRAEPPLSNPAPLVWRAPEGLEGLAAVPVGGRAWPDNTQTPRPIEGRREACGAWPGFETTRQSTRQHAKRRRCGGRRRVRRARAGFEIDHSEPLGSRVAISRAAGPPGARNTSGATSSNSQRGRLAGGPPPTGTQSSPAQQGNARRSSPSEPCARAGASRPGRSGCGPRCAAPRLRCR